MDIKIGMRFIELDKYIYFESRGNIYRESWRVDQWGNKKYLWML